MASTDAPVPSGWLESIAEVLDSLGLEWVVAGAVAAYRYRTEPRFTTDLDILVEQDGRMSAAVEAAGYDVRAVADAGEPPHLVIATRGNQRIDLLVVTTPYQQEAIERGAHSRVLTVEDVIIHKLIANRPRDRDDIRFILDGDPILDEVYLDRWVTEWDVADVWRGLRRG